MLQECFGAHVLLTLSNSAAKAHAWPLESQCDGPHIPPEAPYGTRLCPTQAAQKCNPPIGFRPRYAFAASLAQGLAFNAAETMKTQR